MAFLTRTGRNRRQRFWLVSGLSAPIRFATDCHRLQPRGSIKAPYSVVCISHAFAAATEAQTALFKASSTSWIASFRTSSCGGKAPSVFTACSDL